jgi:predicted nuclease of predicted toxin-antitoxin system
LKLLIDENLAPRLAHDLEDLFPGSVHVDSVGLNRADDAVIWDHAKEAGFTFLTKDKDFANLCITRGAPPKVILLQIGNCSTRIVADLIRRNSVRLTDFDADVRRALLILKSQAR